MIPARDIQCFWEEDGAEVVQKEQRVLTAPPRAASGTFPLCLRWLSRSLELLLA